MGWYYVEHGLVTLLGFLLGAAISHVIAPGNLLLMILAGIVFAAFVQAFVAVAYGTEWFYPVHRPSHKKNGSSCS